MIELKPLALIVVCCWLIAAVTAITLTTLPDPAETDRYDWSPTTDMEIMLFHGEMDLSPIDVHSADKN